MFPPKVDCLCSSQRVIFRHSNVQFKEHQREQAEQSWGPDSWFYQHSGQPIRDIVGRAYGVYECTPKQRALSQEYLTLALSIFARKIGAGKSHVVHAILTGSIDSLIAAIARRAHDSPFTREAILIEDWEAAFREISP